DACFLPRWAHVTGDVDIHEMAWVGDELWFVNTRFSCLCTLDEAHSFVPRWRPPFVTALAPEDRCRLNGLGLAPAANGGTRRGAGGFAGEKTSARGLLAWVSPLAATGCRRQQGRESGRQSQVKPAEAIAQGGPYVRSAAYRPSSFPIPLQSARPEHLAASSAPAK